MTQSDAVQAMIDAHYEYTRLTLDRRKFATKLREMAAVEADRSEVAAPPADLSGTNTGAESLVQ